MPRPGLPTILPAVVGAVLVVGMHCFQTSILAQDTRRPAIADASWRRPDGGEASGQPALAAAPPEPAAPTASDALPDEPYTASLRMEGDSESGDATDQPHDPISSTDPVEAPAPAVIASRKTSTTPWEAHAEAAPRRAPDQADVSMPAPAVEGRVLADPAVAPTIAPELPYRPISPESDLAGEPTQQPTVAATDQPAEEPVDTGAPIAAIMPVDNTPIAPIDTSAVHVAQDEDTARRPTAPSPDTSTPQPSLSIAATRPELPAIAARRPRPMVIRPITPPDPISAPIDDADELTATPAEDDPAPTQTPVRTLTPRAPSVASRPQSMPQAHTDRVRREEVTRIEPVVIAAPTPVAVNAPTAQIEPDQPAVLASVDPRQEAAPTTEVRPAAPTTRENVDTAKPVTVRRVEPKPNPSRSADASSDEVKHPTKDRNLMLMMALQDPDKYVRKWAAEMLGGTGDNRAVKPLIRRLGDSDWWVRRAAMYSLMQLGDDEAIKPITHLLRKGHWKDQQVAALVLGKMKADSAIPALMVQLADGDDRVRIAAAAALGQLGSPQAVPALQKAMRDDDKAVRLAAKRALKRIAESKVAQR